MLTRPDWLNLAKTAYQFIAIEMSRDDRLGHSYRAGKLVFPGVASDYAAKIGAAIALYEATGETKFLTDAKRWTESFDRHYWDQADGAYFAAADDAEGLIVRMKASADEATPSANGLMGENLARLWIQTGDDRYFAQATALFQSLSGNIAGNLYASTSLLAAFDTLIEPIQAVIILPEGGDATDLLQAVSEAADPRVVVTIVRAGEDLAVGHPARAKNTIDGKATVYICRGQTCSLPVTERIHVKHAVIGQA